ncbi:MAG: hypothetical protein A2W90_19035 [Bacteroidetes bacterium GWF2_42_66]|nr:MAG: hypothetical protein A2W92_05845 [Bacteroidetes bacterium GWA2_42_15]OFX98736.1 MAG: hypothetical protein A2W89_10660 [Bacteroidetes bacterium GWE2_42_39]OFY43067.1 MAG: hypothetical protein A2W90_19035 [Bacteroidetes bacterium GWF2_42_66]HBL77090.1 hypothetical protein [Prolixibacteraceae bacterium]HCU59856.1 hypothetical protein [Prolixibacteraceae bacterium]
MDNLNSHIIDQINSKKTEGYKYLYDNFYASLCNFSANFFEYKEDAEDIVQDVFIRIWKSNSTFESLKALTSFLYLSVKNGSLNATRNRPKWSGNDVFDDEDFLNLKLDEKTIEQLLIEEEFYRQIYVTINKLSQERKEVILLSMGGYTNKEIADKTGVSVNTVKTLKLKAYRLLRDTLEPSALAFLLSLMN